MIVAANSITSINPAWFAPLGGLIGGVAAFLGWRRLNKKDRIEREWIEALQRDEILGHKNIRGVADKPSIGERYDHMIERLDRLELMVQQMNKELHPNGGSSMRDEISETHKLAEQAAQHAGHLAKELAEYRRQHP